MEEARKAIREFRPKYKGCICQARQVSENFKQHSFECEQQHLKGIQEELMELKRKQKEK